MEHEIKLKKVKQTELDYKFTDEGKTSCEVKRQRRYVCFLPSPVGHQKDPRITLLINYNLHPRSTGGKNIAEY